MENSKVTEDDILVPQGMIDRWMRAFNSNLDRDGSIVRSRLECALAWLANNPIIPTDEQMRGIAVGTWTATRIVEFQRIMFLKPKPTYSDEVRELLCDLDISGDFHISRAGFNKAIVDAYKIGLGDKPNPDDDDNPDHPSHDVRTT